MAYHICHVMFLHFCYTYNSFSDDPRMLGGLEHGNALFRNQTVILMEYDGFMNPRSVSSEKLLYGQEY